VKTYSVLIVDDHPLISDSYKKGFLKVSSLNKDIDFDIHIVNSSDTAVEKIEEFTHKGYLDIAFLDISIPPSTDGKILSGEDLGLQIKKVLPDTKIIISTTYDDNYRINAILKNIDPDGFLIKNDLDTVELVKAIQAVIDHPPYYSHSVLNVMRNQMSNNFFLDKTDRQLLFELSNGSKMKDLPEVLFLSIAGVERRKRKLKKIFGIENQSDRELLLLAKEKGFI